MTRWILAVLASLAFLGTGLVHGFWTDRWATSAPVTLAAERLPDLPLQIGDWEGTEMEVKPGQAGPGVTGCIQRTYTNRQRGVSVVLALVNGRPGPVAIHTPEACYGGSGFLVGERQLFPLDINGTPAQFWRADASKTTATQDQKLRIYWAWNGGESWVASSDARQEFPRHRFPVLHKLYVLRDLNSTSDAGKDEPCEAFLQALLPALEKTVINQDS